MPYTLKTGIFGSVVGASLSSVTALIMVLTGQTIQLTSEHLSSLLFIITMGALVGALLPSTLNQPDSTSL